jgi:hypothetical protein
MPSVLDYVKPANQVNPQLLMKLLLKNEQLERGRIDNQEFEYILYHVNDDKN